MADYTYLDTTGVIIPDTSTIQSDVQAEYKAVLGADLNTDPSTPQGALITAEVLARSNMVRNNAVVANQINPNLAGGAFLDAICALTGLTRSVATRSVVTCNLTGQPTTIVPEGVRAKTTAGDIFESLATVVLNSSGEATTQFRAIAYGPIAATAGSLNQIVDGVLGWESITNPDAATLGTSTQSDLSLRTLRTNTLALQNVSTPQAITSAVYAVEGVRSLAFLENYYPDPQGALVSVTNGSTLAGSLWGMVTSYGTGTDSKIIVGTDAITFASSNQGIPTDNPWPVAKYTTTANITLSGLTTQSGGDWPGALTGSDIVLVKNQTDPKDNGTYAAASGAWSRVYFTAGEQIMGARGGVSLTPNSFYVCVDGGDNTDVATAILSRKDIGCNYNGNTQVNVVEPATGQTYPVKFERPDEVPIVIEVTVSLNGSLVDPNTAVPQAIMEYVNGQMPNEQGFVVGGAVSPFEIGAAVNANYPTLYIKKVRVAVDTTPIPPVYSTDDIPINKNQVPRTDTGSITVLVV